MLQAMMVCLNLTMPPNDIRAPCIEDMKDGRHFFHICGLFQVLITQLFTSEHQCAPPLDQHYPHAFYKGIIQYRSLMNS